jgi:hypothetical protein
MMPVQCDQLAICLLMTGLMHCRFTKVTAYTWFLHPSTCHVDALRALHSYVPALFSTYTQHLQFWQTMRRKVVLSRLKIHTGSGKQLSAVNIVINHSCITESAAE